jgi:UDP-N-acetyl-D-glucosamine dehydrogenase
MYFEVAIIGQGYVGLPLSIASAKNGFKTLGIDLDIAKVSKLNSGKSVVEDVSDDEIVSSLKDDMYFASSDFSDIEGVKIVIICVPTPLTQKNEPDMSFVGSAAKSIAKFIKKHPRPESMWAML